MNEPSTAGVNSKPPAHTSKDPLHGITLEKILNVLVEHYGWEEMGKRVNIRCFNFDPTVKSSLTFLRKTPWARAKVEQLYVALHRKLKKKAALSRKSPQAPG
jgi:uncharacterized protein (DUF2132 family)